MTLAMPVIVITASNSRKLPKVSWPIESENDRIRRTRAAKGMGIGTGLRESPFYTLESAPRGTCRDPHDAGGKGGCRLWDAYPAADGGARPPPGLSKDAGARAPLHPEAIAAVHAAPETTTTLRAGIVIAVTPITMQPSPVHPVGDRLSPRKTTPSATPIGTRR
jgi:hypothetical protein